jgi:predicted phosphodiesterase
MKIGIINDIHENVEMLEQTLKMAAIHKCDELACLGDIVGFDRRFYRYLNKRSARICIELIRSNCRWIVAGNHDLYAAGKLPSYSNGFEYPENWFMMNPIERKRVSGGKVWCYEGDDPNDLGENEISFLKTLPEYQTENINNITFLFSHYIFPDFTGSTTRYIERRKQLKGLWEFMNHHQAKISFCGHSHNYFTGFAYPYTRSVSRAIQYLPNNNFRLGDELVNVVLPPLTGEKGRNSFSIIDTVNLKLEIIIIGRA